MLCYVMLCYVMRVCSVSYVQISDAVDSAEKRREVK